MQLVDQTTELQAPCNTNDYRFYVIVPETIQQDSSSIGMEDGRLMAQSFHIGRVVENRRAAAGAGYEDITTIVLAVRNARELDKVTSDLVSLQLDLHSRGLNAFPLSTYKDHNPAFYMTHDRVLTALCVGPVLKSDVDSVIGHLELY
jgi:hypothetical protein